ncbi:cytochrome P450 monooxygenase [Lentinula raphanica]|uniref:Cytochrome P450 monooxygenase n=1 Tax=Lentinula raphanica TaxID=153919 RepID=A0AA38PB43_9AGAR|nr:cytochrome P450 monooxygenase [Lentinula raphanica]KAJ3839645.1 cytochrome P450 monooxygenase [Lentinula raphanica]
MPTYTQLIGAVAVALVGHSVFLFVKSRFLSPIRNLPGPRGSSWIYGSLKEIAEQDEAVTHEQWVTKYGRTYKYSAFLQKNIIFTLDHKALNHVLMHHYVWEKHDASRFHFTRIVGPGLLVAEGDHHKLQRRVMNPAFGPAQVRDLTETFIDKSMELKDVWVSKIETAGGTAKINVLDWISKMTLDVIGRAGFNYEFDTLKENGESNKLAHAFAAIFSDLDMEKAKFQPWTVLQTLFPVLRIFPPMKIPGLDDAQETMDKIGKELLHESKVALEASGDDISKLKSKDLLTLLVKSNMSGEPSQRMSDKDVLAQIPTFFVAGHETTRAGTTWALFALVKHLDVQRKLREELLTLATDNPTMDQLNSLHYLDLVVKESLRLYAPVPYVLRVASQDDVIPLSEPLKDKNGVEHHSISVSKGQTVMVPILALNRDKATWGEDAMEFRPERWEKVPEAASTVPGVWSHMLTFLGGPRACIGYRLSLIEMKALLFVLVRDFEFELGVPSEEIIKKTMIVQRPRVKSEPEGGTQLPLLVRLCQKD